MANYEWQPETPEERRLNYQVRRLSRLKEAHEKAAWWLKYSSSGNVKTVQKIEADIKKCQSRILRLEREIKASSLQRQLK